MRLHGSSRSTATDYPLTKSARGCPNPNLWAAVELDRWQRQEDRFRPAHGDETRTQCNVRPATIGDHPRFRAMQLTARNQHHSPRMPKFPSSQDDSTQMRSSCRREKNPGAFCCRLPKPAVSVGRDGAFHGSNPTARYFVSKRPVGKRDDVLYAQWMENLRQSQHPRLVLECLLKVVHATTWPVPTIPKWPRELSRYHQRSMRHRMLRF